MGEVVVHGPEGVLHALEAWVNSKPGAINIVKDFRVFVLKLLYGGINLRVSFSQDLDSFERCGDNPSHVAERLAMLRQQPSERQVGIADHKRIVHGTDQLQSVKPTAGQQAWLLSGCIFGLLSFLCRSQQRGFLRQLGNGRSPIELLHHMAQILVRQFPQYCGVRRRQVPSPCKGRDNIHLAAARCAIGRLLPKFENFLVELLRGGLLRPIGTRRPLRPPPGGCHFAHFVH
mmetsp:Transcript_58831/g.137810  ORF Transcript_58831/g.137810 Transcript_58831/m.137810 type:complete len:231 (-) Transcript_58831:691-1383(-)